MTQTKISGKFYPLKSEEWLDSINKLTHSELKILYYVRSLDPYNNGINLTPAQIARDLSTEKQKMHRSTVSRALKSLDRKGFINMELLQVRIKVNPQGFLSEIESVKIKKDVVATQQCCDHATQVVTTQHSVQPRNIVCSHATQVVTTQQPSAEIKSEQEFQNPKTLKTYLDFKKTLSENEGDNFLNFVREQIHNLERPINDLEAWLASKNAANQNRWEVYYENYQKQGVGQKSRNSQKTSSEGNFTPARNQAIAEFRKRMSLNRAVNELETPSEEFNSNKPELETEPEETNSCRSQEQKTEFDELLDDSLGLQKKSPAQRRREQIAEARAKQQELKQKKQELADERAKQLDQDFEKRKAAMLQQAEEYKQFLQQQNSETDCEKSEIDAEDNEDA